MICLMPVPPPNSPTPSSSNPEIVSSSKKCLIEARWKRNHVVARLKDSGIFWSPKGSITIAQEDLRSYELLLARRAMSLAVVSVGLLVHLGDIAESYIDGQYAYTNISHFLQLTCHKGLL